MAFILKKKSHDVDNTPQKILWTADYAADIVLLVNKPGQAKSLLHSLEQAAEGIGLHVITNKMEYMF